MGNGVIRFRASNTTHVALRELQLSDAVVLIIGSKAGSLIPESEGLTYTAAEFYRAQELGKPIFVFLQSDGGAWRNEETTAELKDALDAFRNAVLKANVTPAYFENPDKLQIELLVALQKWNSQGRPGARLTFTSPKEFFSPFQSATPEVVRLQPNTPWTRHRNRVSECILGGSRAARRRPNRSRRHRKIQTASRLG